MPIHQYSGDICDSIDRTPGDVCNSIDRTTAPSNGAGQVQIAQPKADAFEITKAANSAIVSYVKEHADQYRPYQRKPGKKMPIEMIQELRCGIASWADERYNRGEFPYNGKTIGEALKTLPDGTLEDTVRRYIPLPPSPLSPGRRGYFSRLFSRVTDAPAVRST